jgi:hypothetical protein
MALVHQKCGRPRPWTYTKALEMSGSATCNCEDLAGVEIHWYLDRTVTDLADKSPLVRALVKASWSVRLQRVHHWLVYSAAILLQAPLPAWANTASSVATRHGSLEALISHFGLTRIRKPVRVDAINRKGGKMAFDVVVEHLNHLGIVAEVCREIGVAEWLNRQDPTSRQQVPVGTATVAMVRERIGLQQSPALSRAAVLCG